MAKNVLIATEKPFATAVRDRMVEELKRGGMNAIVLESYSSQKDLLKKIADANGIIVRSDQITAEVMDAAPNLEIIVRAGAGYDTIDVEYAQQKGILVENTPGQNANAVAELALEMMLASARPLDGKPGMELKGKVLAVHGFGNVGRIVARLGKAFGMQVKT